jgi:hypothetical protein
MAGGIYSASWTGGCEEVEFFEYDNCKEGHYENAVRANRRSDNGGKMDQMPYDLEEDVCAVKLQAKKEWVSRRRTSPMICEGYELVQGSTMPDHPIDRSSLEHICGGDKSNAYNNCSGQLGLGVWDICGLSDGQLKGPGQHYHGAMEDERQDGYGCWIACKAPRPKPCSGRSYVTQTERPKNLIRRTQLENLCGGNATNAYSSCSKQIGLGDWDICGLSDGQIKGAGAGYDGLISAPLLPSFSCWITCNEKCNYVKLVNQTSKPDNVITVDNLKSICRSAVDCHSKGVLHMGITDLCGLHDGQISGAGTDGLGAITSPATQQHFSCWVVCTN